jgi:hypothetical protein
MNKLLILALLIISTKSIAQNNALQISIAKNRTVEEYSCNRTPIWNYANGITYERVVLPWMNVVGNLNYNSTKLYDTCNCYDREFWNETKGNYRHIDFAIGPKFQIPALTHKIVSPYLFVGYYFAYTSFAKHYSSHEAIGKLGIDWNLSPRFFVNTNAGLSYGKQYSYYNQTNGQAFMECNIGYRF